MTVTTVIVNGAERRADIEPRTSLADFLRKHCHLTGTHLGCEHGVCGACTVMINGAPARSCISYAVAIASSDVRTIEGFEGDVVMAKLREAFNVEHALQCGFCTPGMLVTAHDIVTRFAEIDERRIRKELAGNICRCTGYVGIVNAIQRVMRELEPAARVGKKATMGTINSTIVAAEVAAVSSASAFEYDLNVGVPDKTWSQIADTFSVPMPKEKVWAVLSDVRRVVLCLPGAEILETDGRNINGRMRMSFGPIKVVFGGRAVLDRDEAAMIGTLNGVGGDGSGNSHAKGRMQYSVTELASGMSQVSVVMDYQLQGPLAQFSRSGLVREFVKHLIAIFAANLEAGVSQGNVTPGSTRPISAAAIFLSALKARLRRVFGR